MKKIYVMLTFLMIFILNVSVYSQPAPPVLLSPANNATGVSVFPTFDWTDVSGATSYRIQVNQGVNTILDISNLSQSQYSVVTAVLTYGTQYYWRAGATNGSGTNWSGYWYFTTQDAPPVAPVLVSPPNGTINVSLTPTLNWNSVANAQFYRVQISTTNTFSSTVLDVSGLVNTGYVVPSGLLINNQQYFWRVNASNTGGTSDWSTVWDFTTIPAPPPAPTLVSPANGAINVSTTVTFNWNTVSTAASYHLQVSSNSAFTALVIDQTGITTTNYATPSGILSGTTMYYWRVAGANAGGQGNWSTYWNFTTIVAPPAAPILISPPNGATGISRNPVLTWNAVPNATSYRVQVSLDLSFTTPIVNAVTGSATQYTVPTALQYGTAYYWRVNATNAGGTGSWSSVWNFTTLIQPPPAPTLLTPPNNQTGVSLTPSFTWSNVATATSYVFQISTNATFTNIIVNVPNLTFASYMLPSGYLVGNTNYYWRVAGVNAGGQGAWAPYFKFTTQQSFTLNLKVCLEGFWNGSAQIRDTVRVSLANANSPYSIIDNGMAYLDEQGNASIGFTNAPNGNYYIIVKHRNHLETWSGSPQSFATGGTTTYNFTDMITKAYGSNMKQVGSVYVLYGGDANQDGFVNGTDYTIFKSQFGLDRYKNADFNGDDFVDGYDALILYSNLGKSIARPY
ncbi:MAG: dockerin type I domain-containing protein [Bacteroidetes bacterium]|nr:dockerin type I domain-containing protein [Bacteroidota bacterium]